MSLEALTAVWSWPHHSTFPCTIDEHVTSNYLEPNILCLPESTCEATYMRQVSVKQMSDTVWKCRWLLGYGSLTATWQSWVGWQQTAVTPIFQLPVTGIPEGSYSSLLCYFELRVISTPPHKQILKTSYRRLIIPKLTSHFPPSFKAEGTKVRVIKAFSWF